MLKFIKTKCHYLITDMAIYVNKISMCIIIYLKLYYNIDMYIGSAVSMPHQTMAEF